MVDGEEDFNLPSCLDPRTSSGPNDLLPTRASSEPATAPLVIEPSVIVINRNAQARWWDFYAGNVGSAPAPPKGGYISTKPGVVVLWCGKSTGSRPRRSSRCSAKSSTVERSSCPSAGLEPMPSLGCWCLAPESTLRHLWTTQNVRRRSGKVVCGARAAAMLAHTVSL
eukprot:scaffold18892_cov183-Isochrysis_galbana.AAC.1